MNRELIRKENQAVWLIKQFAEAAGQTIEIAYSGGKDSDVILALAQRAGVKYSALYKNTTIDPPGTLAHCISKGVIEIKPEKTFLQLVAEKGMPTRRARFCCTFLKEYKLLDYQIQGIRRCESDRRARQYDADSPTICRNYGNKKNHVEILLPILNWTDEEVKEFIEVNNVKCHNLYYNHLGEFDVTRRLGCIGCPLQGDQGRKDYRLYPKLFKQVAKQVGVWWDNHPNAKSHQKFGSHYDLIGHNLFFRTYESYCTYTLGRTDGATWKQLLEEYFKIDLD